MNSSLSDVVDTIDRAFANVHRTRLGDIPRERLYEDDERQVAVTFFSGRRREDLTVDSLTKEYQGDFTAAPAFLPLQLLRYYFPQFMKLCALYHNSLDLLPVTLLTILSGGRSDDEDAWSLSFIQSLDMSQRVAVVSYVVYMRENYPGDFYGLDFDYIVGRVG